METGGPPRINVENRHVCIPRGGPVFVPDLVSSITRVPDFESNVFREIEILKAELSSTPSTLNDDDNDDEEVEDISVDELKLMTDEELLDAAMNEILKDSCESSNGSSHQAGDGGEAIGAMARKRKRQIKSKSKSKGKDTIVHDKNNNDDEGYLLIAEKFAKVNQKQKEEKTAAKLHSLTTVVSDTRPKNKSEALSSENSGRIQSLLSLINPTKVNPSQVGEHVPINFPEVVLCVEVYHWKRTTQKVQEIMVLGCQLLTELRDKIYCLIDGVMEKAGNHDPSGYFLIEDVFYNDLRDPSAIDYSTPILDWLKNSPGKALEKWECVISGVAKQNNNKVVVSELTASRLPRFKAVDMHKVRFCDLKFRLGAGYLYCHQVMEEALQLFSFFSSKLNNCWDYSGDCKHTIIIRDMRLIHPEDVQNKAAYPLVSYRQKFILTKCSVCKLYKATKVTFDDKWAGENPCFFCDNCYFLLHYAEDGSLLYDQFSVYEYLQDY